VLLLHEEGFGDTLQFVRYANLLASRGARVTLCVPQELVRLVRGVAGVAEVATRAEDLPAADYVCPFFSLPRAFATTLRTIPAQIPYLRPNPEDVARWRVMLPWSGTRKLRVGLVWAGQARPWLPGFAAVDRRRGVPPAAFAALAGPGRQFVSLQKGGAADALPSALRLHDPMPEVTDFADTAAVIAQLDVVVSVDTSVVHLAGGMGKTVLMLDRFDACWRWLSGRRDSPWYPGLRIFRQSSPCVWDDAMTGVAAALDEMAAAHADRETELAR
jgi:hypothetical protein